MSHRHLSFFLKKQLLLPPVTTGVTTSVRTGVWRILTFVFPLGSAVAYSVTTAAAIKEEELHD